MSAATKIFRFDLRAVLAALLLALAAPSMAANGACPAANGTLAQRAAAIALGHSYGKHQNEFVQGTVIAGLAFPHATINSAIAFATFVQGIMTAPSASRGLNNNRIAYWDAATGTVVIYNPNAGDCGTAFRPTAGMTYYNNLN